MGLARPHVLRMWLSKHVYDWGLNSHPINHTYKINQKWRNSLIHLSCFVRRKIRKVSNPSIFRIVAISSAVNTHSIFGIVDEQKMEQLLRCIFFFWQNKSAYIITSCEWFKLSNFQFFININLILALSEDVFKRFILSSWCRVLHDSPQLKLALLTPQWVMSYQWACLKILLLSIRLIFQSLIDFVFPIWYDSDLNGQSKDKQTCFLKIGVLWASYRKVYT